MADDQTSPDDAMNGSGARQPEVVRVRANANAFGLTVGQEGELERDGEVEMALHLGMLDELEAKRPRRRAKRAPA